MKNLYKTIMTLILILVMNFVSAQDLTTFSESLNNGDVKCISKMLDEKAEVSILNEESYTKTEATLLLNSFFTEKKEFSYKPIHKGKTIEEAYYQIGELVIADNTYRTYIYTKNVDGNFLIKEFRIELQ